MVKSIDCRANLHFLTCKMGIIITKAYFTGSSQRVKRVSTCKASRTKSDTKHCVFKYVTVSPTIKSKLQITPQSDCRGTML